jgi:RimJ/RimL family protein N-acetyltransferase
VHAVAVERERVRVVDETRPPEVVAAGAFTLRRLCVDDAAAIAEAVAASLSELRPWMPWATDEATDPAWQQQRLQNHLSDWDRGSSFDYVIVDDGRVLGVIDLSDRAGAGALELGYWLRSDYSGRGIATACAAALTSAALALPGVSRVEIHCDEANVRSASLARRLGYQLVRIEDDEIAAPGETGRNMIWIYSGA